MADAKEGRPGSLSGHLRQLGSQSVVYGLGLAATQGLGFLLLPLVTRYLSPTEFGIAAVMTSIGVVVGIVLAMGVDSAALRHYYDHKEGEPLRRHLGATFVFLTGTDLALVLLLHGCSRPIASLAFGAPSYAVYLRLAAWSSFFRMGAALPLVVLRAREKAGLFTLYSIGSAVMSRGCMVLLVLAWRHDAFAYLLGLLIGDGIFYLVFLRFMLREVSLPAGSARASVVRSLRFGLPLVPHQLSHWVLGVVDRLMLQRLASFAAAGLYSAGSSVGMIMSLVGQGLSIAWSPFLYRLYAEHPQEADHTASRLATHYVAFLTLTALALSLASPEVVRLMVAPSYQPARGVVPLIVGGYWVHCLYHIPVSYLFLRERTAALPVLTAGAALLNIATNLLWIPAIGIMAPGWAKIAAYAGLTGAVTFYAQRVHRCPYEWGRLARIALAGIAAASAGEWVVRHNLTTGMSVLARLGSLLGFVALLLMLGAYRVRDLRRLGQLLGRR